MPELATVGIGSYLASAQLLGQRTAELHRLLAESDDAAFAPEPFTMHYQRSLYEHIRTRGQRALNLLKTHKDQLPEPTAQLARTLLENERKIQDHLKRLLKVRTTAVRQRTHGDYHLGQVLYTGADFVVIDFEGEPGRPQAERRFKRTPLIDVAGMLRSFHYASTYALKHVRDADVAGLLKWADFWRSWVSAAFLRAYMAEARSGLPKSEEETALLLELLVLEKAFYELGYELNHRPEWVDIPLRGLLQIIA